MHRAAAPRAKDRPPERLVAAKTGWAIYAESKRRWMAGDLEFTHEGGESFADIRRRVLPVFEELRGSASRTDRRSSSPTAS